ncbi:ABC transporter ATP-binding protein [Janthinobacterium sp. BJB401]|uniref:ABC transporter ATP-binding protein n=1 Tax=Janthinobacterium sp. BJB401 TaxID=2745934 RepID=UPI0020CE30A7|nr:ABC transporter ATP-binding protein [Janthinobacterium sp. BJB401]
MSTPAVTPWRDTYRQLLRSAGPLAPQLRRALHGLALAAAVQGLALACLFPFFRAMLTAPAPRTATAWLGAMTALMLVSSVLRWRAQGFDYDGKMAATTHALRTRLGAQLRRMPLELLRTRRAGEINATLLGNVDEHFNYALSIINIILLALVTPLVTALAALAFDWRLGLLLLLVFPAIVPLYRWRRPAYGRGMRALAAAHQRSAADIVEYTQGLPVLRSARSVGARATTLQASLLRLQQLQTMAQKKGAKPNVVVASVVELGLLLVVAAGVAWVVQGSLDLGMLAAVLVVVVRFAEPLATFVSYTAIFELIEAALERIEALLAVPPLPQLQPAQAPVGHAVTFEGVTFAYADAGQPALRGFGARLAPNSMTALVGPSGSGKTTVARLLLRHADPQQGRIAIGGADLRHLGTEALDRLVGVVFQEVYLFDDSVLANIRMARPEASDDEVRAAAGKAQCIDFIERLPQGWHTPLGDNGARLSGGERQRLSIARALLKDAPIVILDEPTAALDTESEVAVQRAIDALVRDKTVIVIAHRLSTIAGAAQILVIADGQLAEQGTHGELLARHGKYHAMWQAQQAVKSWRLAGPPASA